MYATDVYKRQHIVHNCLQTAVDVLPIEVEALVVKIYKYFYIYTAVSYTHLDVYKRQPL